ncbi:hypothetical protein AB1Y20_021034 [Prymnesium parvum]|uniref:CWF21 domain-containing protein n=1 Tax=Prymnesium parvum TaxID=97485 RepID=A0AB34JK63_PRYPA
MYNGIGLATVRGSGTNGYVQKNMSHVSRVRTAERKDIGVPVDFAMKEPRAPNMEIVEHNRKREVELQVLRLRETLEDEGLEPQTIERKVSALRADLLAELQTRIATPQAGTPRSGETHADAAMKQSENVALKSALGISSSYVSGSAFDRELQARQKAERLAKRAAEEAEVLAMESALEREKLREQKARRKEERAREKQEERTAKRRKRDAARV